MTEKITGLTPMTTLENDDPFEVVDKSDLSSSTTGTNKQVTIVEIETKLSADGFTKTDEVLTKVNITPYTPTALYHPSTKEYVDIKTLLLSGVNDMDPGYTPLNPLSVVTKEYIDNTVSFIPITTFVTNSQTIVKPTGANYVYIKLYGAGGGGGGSNHSSVGNGTNGGNGGVTSIVHLTRTFTANGGGGGLAGQLTGTGGTAGAIIDSQRASFVGLVGANASGLTGGNGANGEYMITGNAVGGVGIPSYSSDSIPGLGLGAGGGGSGSSNRTGGGGGGSGSLTEIILTAEDIDIIVGAGGTGGTGQSGVNAGGQGSDGLAIITWY